MIDIKKLEGLSQRELTMIIVGISAMLEFDVEGQIKESVQIDEKKIGYKLYMEGFIQGGEYILKSIKGSLDDLIDNEMFKDV